MQEGRTKRPPTPARTNWIRRAVKPPNNTSPTSRCRRRFTARYVEHAPEHAKISAWKAGNLLFSNFYSFDIRKLIGHLGKRIVETVTGWRFVCKVAHSICEPIRLRLMVAKAESLDLNPQSLRAAQSFKLSSTTKTSWKVKRDGEESDDEEDLDDDDIYPPADPFFLCACQPGTSGTLCEFNPDDCPYKQRLKMEMMN
ncbi:unnamed protein product, partial [Mesorhabditis belari]|uniref:Uncharacterized protein n=1 Tax=Mesorhabditis belari TaxID=2138241 RepID=A0AAF3EHK4_9BILA